LITENQNVEMEAGSDSMLGWDRRYWACRLNQQRLQWHAVPVLRQQHIRIDLDADGIRGESIAMHKDTGVGCIGEAVNLKLHAIPVRVLAR
jgi:hypothetical protein